MATRPTSPSSVRSKDLVVRAEFEEVAQGVQAKQEEIMHVRVDIVAICGHFSHLDWLDEVLD